MNMCITFAMAFRLTVWAKQSNTVHSVYTKHGQLFILHCISQPGLSLCEPNISIHFLDEDIAA